MTPSRRPDANKETLHHMWWRAKDYRYGSREAGRLRAYGAFVIPAMGFNHDLLHKALEPLAPPPSDVCDTIYQIAIETDFSKPYARVRNIVDEVIVEAIAEPSYEQSDHLMMAASHLNAQLGVLTLGTFAGRWE